MCRAADDVADLVDELRVGRELEVLAQVRLEAEGQIRLIADCDIPVAFAIERVDQWVASSGVSSSVLTITRSS